MTAVRIARTLAATAVTAALALLLSGGPAAQADCGGVLQQSPTHWSHSYRPPLVLGDSTMIFALPYLAKLGFTANAHGCRQYPEALALMDALRHAGTLPHLVVIALGANGYVTTSDVQDALRIIGRSRQLALVTPRQAGGTVGPNATVVRNEGRLHPRQITVLDWASFSAGHASWFQPDGLHLTYPGAAALADLIGHALPLARPAANRR